MQGLPDHLSEQLQGLGIVDASPAPPAASSAQYSVTNAPNPSATYRGPPPGYHPQNHHGLAQQQSGQALLDALLKRQMGQTQPSIDPQGMQWPPQNLGGWQGSQATPYQHPPPPADHHGWPNGPAGNLPPGYTQPWGGPQAPPPPMRGPPPGFDLQHQQYTQYAQPHQHYLPQQQQFAQQPQQPPQQPQQPPQQLGSLFGTPLQGSVGTPPRRPPPPGFGPPSQPSPGLRPVDANPARGPPTPARPVDQGQSPGGAHRPTRGPKPADRGGPVNTASSVFREFRNRNRCVGKLLFFAWCDGSPYTQHCIAIMETMQHLTTSRRCCDDDGDIITAGAT